MSGLKSSGASNAAPSGPALPARVRITRPPLPLAPALAKAAAQLLPGTDLRQVQSAALAIAGGSVIGAALKGAAPAVGAESAVSGSHVGVAPGWRGKGIEMALAAALDPAK